MQEPVKISVPCAIVSSRFDVLYLQTPNHPIIILTTSFASYAMILYHPLHSHKVNSCQHIPNYCSIA